MLPTLRGVGLPVARLEKAAAQKVPPFGANLKAAVATLSPRLALATKQVDIKRDAAMGVSAAAIRVEISLAPLSVGAAAGNAAGGAGTGAGVGAADDDASSGGSGTGAGVGGADDDASSGGSGAGAGKGKRGAKSKGSDEPAVGSKRGRASLGGAGLGTAAGARPAQVLIQQSITAFKSPAPAAAAASSPTGAAGPAAGGEGDASSSGAAASAASPPQSLQAVAAAAAPNGLGTGMRHGYILAATTADLNASLVHWQTGIIGPMAITITLPRPVVGPRVTIHLLHESMHGFDSTLVLQPSYRFDAVVKGSVAAAAAVKMLGGYIGVAADGQTAAEQPGQLVIVGGSSAADSFAPGCCARAKATAASLAASESPLAMTLGADGFACAGSHSDRTSERPSDGDGGSRLYDADTDGYGDRDADDDEDDGDVGTGQGGSRSAAGAIDVDHDDPDESLMLALMAATADAEATAAAHPPVVPTVGSGGGSISIIGNTSTAGLAARPAASRGDDSDSDDAAFVAIPEAAEEVVSIHVRSAAAPPVGKDKAPEAGAAASSSRLHSKV